MPSKQNTNSRSVLERLPVISNAFMCVVSLCLSSAALSEIQTPKHVERSDKKPSEIQTADYNALEKKIANIRQEAESLYEFGEQKHAINILEKAQTLCKEFNDKATLSKVELRLSQWYRSEGKHDVALHHANQSLILARALYDGLGTAQSNFELGLIYLEKNQTALAQKALHEAEGNETDTYLDFRVQKELGILYESQGDTEEAIRYYLKSIETIETIEQSTKELTGPITTTTLDAIPIHVNLAKLYDARPQSDTASEYHQKIAFLVEKIRDDGDRRTAYRRLARTYRSHQDIENSLKYNLEALSISKIETDKQHLANDLESVATDLRKLGLYTEALPNAQEALSLYREEKNLNRICSILQSLSIIYRRLSQFDESLKYANELVDLREKQGNIKYMASAYNTMGLVYSNLERNDESSHFFNLTLALPAEKTGQKLRAQALRALSDVYEKAGNHKAALTYANRALKHFLDLNNISGIESTYRSIGKIHKSMGNTDKALRSFEEALLLAKSVKNRWSEGDAHSKIALLIDTTQPIKAIEHANKAVEIGKNIEAKSLVLDAVIALANAHEKLGNYQTANNYSKQKYDIFLKISEDEITTRVADLKVARQAHKREQELSELKHKDELNRLQLDSASNELESLNSLNDMTARKLRQERTVSGLLIAFTVLVILALILIYNRYRLARRHEDELNQKNELIESKKTELEEINAAKDRLFSIIAHDLRGPVIAISESSKLLIDSHASDSPETINSFLNEIYNSSSRTLDLLEELLQWGIEQQRVTIAKPSVISLKSTIESVSEALSSVAKTKNILIQNSVEAEISIFADQNMIRTILRNLISNAIKFTPTNTMKPPEIHVFTIPSKNPNHLEVHVRDFGLGIREKDLERLFDIDNTHSRRGTRGEKGTGFGLSLCRDLARKNKGELYVESEDGKGSDFYFVVPMAS